MFKYTILQMTEAQVAPCHKIDFLKVIANLGEDNFNLGFRCQGRRENYYWHRDIIVLYSLELYLHVSGRLVDKIIIILSFRIDTSKNKNIGHRGKKHQTNHIS